MTASDYFLEIVRLDGDYVRDRTFERCLILVGENVTLMECSFDHCDIRDMDGRPLEHLSQLGMKLDRPAAKLLGPEARASGALYYRDDLE